VISSIDWISRPCHVEPGPAAQYADLMRIPQPTRARWLRLPRALLPVMVGQSGPLSTRPMHGIRRLNHGPVGRSTQYSDCGALGISKDYKHSLISLPSEPVPSFPSPFLPCSLLFASFLLCAPHFQPIHNLGLKPNSVALFLAFVFLKKNISLDPQASAVLLLIQAGIFYSKAPNLVPFFLTGTKTKLKDP